MVLAWCCLVVSDALMMLLMRWAALCYIRFWRIYFQCGSSLVSAISTPFPPPLAMITQFFVLWLVDLAQGTLIALGLSRIFLILKVLTLEERIHMYSILSQQSSSSLTMRGISRGFWEVFLPHQQPMFCLLWSSAIWSNQVLHIIYSTINCIPWCSRQTSILGIAHGSKARFKFQCDNVFPHLSRLPDSSFHD